MNYTKEELDKLKMLIMSWQEVNVELAVQIMEGSNSLKAAIEEWLKPITNALKIPFDIAEDLMVLKRKFGRSIFKPTAIPYSPSLIPFVESLGIEDVYYTYLDLQEFPWWLEHCPNLRVIDLQHNLIQEIPDWIGSLKKLTKLNVDHNLLKSIPDGIGELRILKKLQLDFNKIEQIPESIGQLKKLNWLCLEANNIEYLPKSAVGLEGLSWLSVEKTPLGKRLNINSGMYISTNSSRFQAMLEP